MSEDTIICSGWHHTFGWLRRPELDEAASGYCYETPDGDIVISRRMRHRKAIYLDCREDIETGERYTAISKKSILYKGNTK